MPWLNSSGNPVSVQPVTIQIDVPSESVGDRALTLTAVNWGAVLSASIQLVIAMMTGNPTAIASAIQALINALMNR